MSDTEATIETTNTSASEANVESGLAAEIASAVEAAAVEADPEPEAAEPEAAPEPEAAEENEPEATELADTGDADVEAEPEADEPQGLPEALLERAVLAGIPLSEARQYPSQALLESMVSRLDGEDYTAGSLDDAGTTDEGMAEAAFGIDAIPDLDPEDYDEKIVGGFKAMKGIIRQQSELIERLTQGKSQDFLSTKLDGVKDYHQGDPEKIGAVKAKFNVLKAGYEAAGQETTRDAIFEEAAQLVLGADMVSAKQNGKAKAAARRSGKRIARPSGNRVKPVNDPFEEVAKILDRKFG
jgi:hypothetical protein